LTNIYIYSLIFERKMQMYTNRSRDRLYSTPGKDYSIPKLSQTHDNIFSRAWSTQRRRGVDLGAQQIHCRRIWIKLKQQENKLN